VRKKTKDLQDKQNCRDVEYVVENDWRAGEVEGVGEVVEAGLRFTEYSAEPLSANFLAD